MKWRQVWTARGSWWKYAVPLVLGGALAWILVSSLTLPAAPVPAVGASPWTKYALGAGNNPVVEGATERGWTASWTVHTPEPLQQLSVAGGVVYAVGDGSQPGDGNLYAFDAATGALRWKTHLNNESMTTPVVAQGLVFVGTGNQLFSPQAYRRDETLSNTHIVRGTGANAVYALSAKTGQVVWQFSTPGEDMPSFVYRRGMLYVANGNGKVYGLDAADGELRWSATIGSYVSMSSPALAGALLLVSGAHPYDVYAISVRTHRIVWSAALPGVFAGSDDSSIAVMGQRVFLEGTVGTLKAGQTDVFAYSLRGCLLWKTPIGTGPVPNNIEVGTPVAVGGAVYAGTPLSNREVALSPTTGRILWRFQALGPVASSVAVYGGRVLVADEKGTVYALDAHTGQMLMARMMGGDFAASYPVVVGATMFLASQSGQVDAVPLAAWNRRWATGGPEVPWPKPSRLTAAIRAGESLFRSHALSPMGLSCSQCHLGAGTLPGYARGRAILPLIGVASLFPMVRGGKIMTLDAQINHCLKGMGAPPLSVDSTRLGELNVYLNWLASAFPSQMMTESPDQAGGGGGC